MAVSLARALGVQSRHFSIVTDEGEDLTGAYYFAMVGNMGSVGAGITLCPEARLDDGRLDLTLMTPMPLARLRIIGYLAQCVRGGLVEDAFVSFRQTTGLTMSGGTQDIYADGERIGPLPVRIECAPKALRVIVP